MIDLVGIWIWFSAAIALALIIQLIVNMLVMPRLRSEPPPEDGLLVSVLVPARNESLRIRSCLVSLLRQNYPFLEIIVLDDESTDDTAEIAGSLGFSVATDSNRRLLLGAPLPEGWSGKSWACQQLADAAHGQYLLFVDADTVHAPGAVSSIICGAERYRADLLTLWPYQITGTFAEKLVIPLLYVVAGSFLPHWLIALAQRSASVARILGPDSLSACGTANGQCLLFSRQSYDRLGGHRSIKSHLVEDISLGREVAKRIPEGLRLISCDGTGLVRCRMYDSPKQLCEGFTKNLWPAFNGDLIGFWFALAWQAVVLVLPFALVLFFPRPDLGILIFLILALRSIAATRFHTSWISVLLHPLGYGFALLIAVNSLWRSNGEGVIWKERVYRGRTAGNERSPATLRVAKRAGASGAGDERA